MTVRNLEHALTPRSVAVVGASTEEGSVGGTLTKNMLAGDFKGEVYLVNPHHDAIAGRRCFPDIAALPEPPELAVIATPPATSPSLSKHSARRVRVPSSSSPQGLDPISSRRCVDQAQPYLLRIIGPNCLGMAVPGLGLHANFGLNSRRRGSLPFFPNRARSSPAFSIGLPRAISASPMSSPWATWPMSMSATFSTSLLPTFRRERSCFISRPSLLRANSCRRRVPQHAPSR